MILVKKLQTPNNLSQLPLLEDTVSSSGDFYKLFAIRNFFYKNHRKNKIFSSVIRKVFNQVKVCSLEKFKINLRFFYLHLIMKRLIILIKVEKIVKCSLKKKHFSTPQK